MLDYVLLLQEKVTQEYNDFVHSLAKLPPNEIIERAYEKVYREDLKYTILDKKLDYSSSKTLYQLPNTLETCYQEWLRNDLSHMDLLNDTVDEVTHKYADRHKDKGHDS